MPTVCALGLAITKCTSVYLVTLQRQQWLKKEKKVGWGVDGQTLKKENRLKIIKIEEAS